MQKSEGFLGHITWLGFYKKTWNFNNRTTAQFKVTMYVYIFNKYNLNLS